MEGRSEDFNKFFNLNFVGKAHGMANCLKDITIAKTKDGASIAFRNGVHKKIGQCAVVAVKGDYVFFKEDLRNGWMLSPCGDKSKSDNRYMRVKQKFVDLSEFIGDYDLLYMEPIGLYYIKKEDK